MRSVALISALLSISLELCSAAPRPKSRPNLPSPNLILNREALRPFLAALSNLEPAVGNRVVRVLHFGDSHTAADYWTGRIRRRLQERFGDAGPGLVLPGRPWRGYPHEGVRFFSGRNWPAQSLRSTEVDGWVGLPGAAVSGVEGEAFHLRAQFNSFTVQVLAPPGFSLHGAVLAPEEDTTPESATPPLLPTFSALSKLSENDFSGRALQVFGPPEPSGDANGKTSVPKLQDLMFRLGDDVQLLGIDLRSGRAGLLYDELGLNGAQLLDLEKWNPELRRALLAQSKPDLVVLAYGTNDEGMGGASALDYQSRMKVILRKMREESQAPILVIGPLDRFGNHRRSRPLLKTGALRVIGDMKQACLAEGCAFWDARESMGGYGSIRQWRRSGLAKRDLVHLTAKGYELLGDRLYDQLLDAYALSKQPSATSINTDRQLPGKRPKPTSKHWRKRS